MMPSFEYSSKFKAQRSTPTDMLIRIHYSHDCAIRRRIFAFERKARFFSPAPKDQLADAGAGSINGDHRFALRREIFVERLHHKQLAILQRIVLHCGNHGSDYARELHFKISPESGVSTPKMESDRCTK